MVTNTESMPVLQILTQHHTRTELIEHRRKEFSEGMKKTLSETRKYYKSAAERHVLREESTYAARRGTGKTTRTELFARRREEMRDQPHREPVRLPSFQGQEKPFYSILSMKSPPMNVPVSPATSNRQNAERRLRHPTRPSPFTDEDEFSRDDDLKVNRHTHTVSARVGGRPKADVAPTQLARIPYAFPLRPGRATSCQPRFTQTIDRTDGDQGFIERAIGAAAHQELSNEPLFSSFSVDGVYRPPKLPRPERSPMPNQEDISGPQQDFQRVAAAVVDASLDQPMQAVILGRSIAPRGVRSMRFDLTDPRATSARTPGPRVRDAGAKRRMGAPRPVSCPPNAVRTGGFSRFGYAD